MQTWKNQEMLYEGLIKVPSNVKKLVDLNEALKERGTYLTEGF